MDHLQLLKRLLLLICALLASSVAQAATTYNATVTYKYQAGDQPTASTPGGACTAGSIVTDGTVRETVGQPGFYDCWVPLNQGYGNFWQIAKVQTLYTCPQGGTLSGTQCVGAPDCPEGQVRALNGQCIEDCQAKIGQTFAGATLLNQLQNSYCVGDCQVKLITGTKGGSICMGNSPVTLAYPCDTGVFGYTGAQCAGSPTLPQQPQAPPEICPPNKCAGTVNGVTVCVDCGNGNKRTDIEGGETTNSDGSKTTTQRETTYGGDGAGSVTTTTTTTNTDPAGNVTGTTTTKQNDQFDSFCKENPSLTICKNSSFGGNCAAFTCDGDAIQCAVAREQHKRNCTLFDTQTTLSQLGDSVAAGTDPQAANYPTAPGQQQTISLTNAIDSTNPLATGCISDKSFTFPNFTLTIPLSMICPYLEFMGQIVLAFAFLMAARITFGGLA